MEASRALLHINHLMIPSDMTSPDEMVAYSQSNVVDRFSHISLSQENDFGRVKGLSSTMHYIGLTLRSLISMVWHVFTTTIFALATVLTLGKVKGTRTRLATHFTHFTIGAYYVGKSVVGIFKPSKAREKQMTQVAQGVTRLMLCGQAPDGELIDRIRNRIPPEGASEKRALAFVESPAQNAMYRASALHTASNASKKWVGSSYRYGKNTLYSLVALVWNVFSLAIFGLACLFTGFKKQSLKNGLKLQLASFEPTAAALAKSVQGVFQPGLVSKKCMERLSDAADAAPPPPADANNPFGLPIPPQGDSPIDLQGLALHAAGMMPAPEGATPPPVGTSVHTGAV